MDGNGTDMVSPERERKVKEAAIAVVLSAVLHLSGFLSFLFTLPLLSFLSRHERKDWWCVSLPALAVCVFSAVWTLWGADHFLFYVSLDLFIPVSLLAAGTVWSGTRRGCIERRLLLSILPSILFALVLGAVLSLDRALSDALYQSFRDVFATSFGELFETLGLGGDMDFLCFAISISLGSMLIPLTAAAVCVSLFYYETGKHSKESGWEGKVAGMELDENSIWFLILSAFLLLLNRFVSMPAVVSMALMSLVMLALMLYAAQGFSVVFALMRRKNGNLRSFPLFVFLVLVAIMVPGLNMIVLFGLPILGVVQNFFDLKNRRKK